MRPVSVTPLFLAGSIFWMLPASLFSDDAFPSTALGSLASEEYKDRVQAQRDLLAWAAIRPEQGVDRLLREYDAATDPEVRLRVREALKEVVVAEHQRQEGQGYVGIQMDEKNVVLPGAGEQRGGVWITRVNAGTPAESAGLQVNDVVVALDGLKWPEGLGARESFATEIRRHKPGDRVSLEILRGNELKKVELILGARPMGMDQATQLLLFPGGVAGDIQEEIERLDREAREAYFERWLATRRAGPKKP